MAEDDVLTVTVDGEVITELNHVFATAGMHTVVYEIRNAEGELLDKATVMVFVKANSTQNSAETNFNQGYFDGREFSATAGVAVKDGALYFKSEQTALFTTAGYSESFILTFDIVSYVSGELKVVFGMIGDEEYAFTFLADGIVKFGEEEYDVGKDVYQILADGNKVTVRVKVFGGKATLYLRASDESVENIDVELLTVSDVILVGKAGFGGANAEFTADNVKFVSLTSLDEDNTYHPSDEELNPDNGDDSTEDSSGSSSDSTEYESGCFGGITAGSMISFVILMATALIKRKRS